MKCLVTGGAGFIGSHIATALVERGDAVRVFDNFSTGSRKNLSPLGAKVEVVEGDVTDCAEVERAVRGVEVVFHEAAMASVPRSVAEPLASHAACATGTLHVLDAARRHGVRRVVYAASSSAYGNDPKMPKRETDLPSPISPYAAAKLAGEAYCQVFAATYGLETVALRYFNVFGPAAGSQQRILGGDPKICRGHACGPAAHDLRRRRAVARLRLRIRRGRSQSRRRCRAGGDG